jgi:hypothetical protein
VKEELLPMNPDNFAKMAHGDPAGLMEMAFDYFNETRHLMTGWMALIEAGDFGHLCEDLHRCKGGASLFGLERLVALLGECERPAVLEQRGFDIEAFESELSAAENAVLAMAKRTCC